MRWTLVLLAVMIATPVFAALPPQYYEQARRDADTIVVVEVADVSAPPMPQGYGGCIVSGRVIGVERGAQYEVGAPISLNVSCRLSAARTPIGGVLYKDYETLQQARYGRAFLTPAGEVALSQYDILNEWTGPLPP